MDNETLQWIAIGLLVLWLLLLSLLYGAQHHQLNIWWWDFLKDMKKDWEKRHSHKRAPTQSNMKDPQPWDDGHGDSWPPTY